MWRVLILALALTACTQFPQLDGVVGPEVVDAKFPSLIPIDPIVNAPEGQGADRAIIQDNLLARLAALNARGAALRGAVIDNRTRRRLEKGVAFPDYAKES